MLILDKVINKFIALDDESMALLKKLKGKQINVELENTNTKISIHIESSGLNISNDPVSKADLVVKGTPLELLNYVMQIKQGDPVQSASIEITGDISLAQNFQSIFSGLDVDWEEQFAMFAGDVVAYKAGRVLTGSVKYLKQSHDHMKRNLSEYLRYEKSTLININELEEFSHAVDRLRDDTARLKARIERIDQSRNKR